MSSYSNFYNPYRYGAADDNDDLTRQYRRSLQPPQGYQKPTYGWNSQDPPATESSGSNDSKMKNGRTSYTTNQDVYSHAQRYSSNSVDLSSYANTTRAQDAQSAENSGMNSLLYVSALESALLKKPSSHSNPPERTSHGGSFPSSQLKTAPSHAAAQPYSFNKSPSLSQPSSRTRPPSAVSYNATAPDYVRYSNESKPTAFNSSPTMNDHNVSLVSNNALNQRAPDAFSHHPGRSSPIVSQASTSRAQSNSIENTLSGTAPRPTSSSPYNGQSSYANLLFKQGIAAPAGATHAQQTRGTVAPLQPTMAHKFPSESSGNRMDVTTASDMKKFQEQISPLRVQYINPNDLYNQQYFMEQERQQTAAAEAAETQRRLEEAEALEAERNEEKTKAVQSESAKKSKPKKQPSAKNKKTATASAELNASAPSPNPQAKSELDNGDDMAIEMRTMLEKLRSMRSKDPSLFSKLWDDFKKAPTGHEAAPEAFAQADEEAVSSPVLTTLALSATPTAKKKASNAQAHSIDGLPDLGKFPAQRQRQQMQSKDEALENPSYEGRANESASQPSASASLKIGAMINDTVTTSQIATAVTKQMVLQDNSHKRSPATPSGLIDGMPDLGKFPAARRKRVPKPNAVPEAGAKAGTTSFQTDQNVPNAAKPISQQQKGVSIPDHKLAAQQVVQPQPTQPIWATATKQKLSQTLFDYLVKDSANKGKQVSPESLILLLGNNITYAGLCSQLESRGFSLDRQAMAQFLLAAVPELSSSHNSSEDQDKSLPKATAPPQMYPSQIPRPHQGVIRHPPVPMQPSRPTAPEMIVWNTNTETSTSSTLPITKNVPTLVNGNAHLTVPAAALNRGAGSMAVRIGHERLTGGSYPPAFSPLQANLDPSVHTPAPGSKADLARKRLFSEIVDLSQFSDDEDDYSNDEDINAPPKQPRLQDRKAPAFASTERDALAPAENPMDLSSGEPSLQPLSRSPKFGPPPADLSKFAFNSDEHPSLEEIRKFPGITKPLNDAAALQRIYYNPKTIARDILIAAGRHPSERPLNHHLMMFQDIFSDVTSKSDLETFRWDVVDPGGPPMPIVEPEHIVTHPPPVPRKRREGGKRSRDVPSVPDKPLPTSAMEETPVQQVPLQASLSSLHSPKGQGNTTMVSPSVSSSATRRRGRPPSSKAKKASQVAPKAGQRIEVAIPLGLTVPDPSYPIFQCDWNNCQGQLHDIKTLKLHVNKVHISGETSCRWHGCPNAVRRLTSEELRKHLELAHIQPLAWKYGEGPSVNGTALLSDQYLNNGDGTKITPNTATAGEIDSLIFPVESTPVRAYHRLHGNQAAVERARQVLKAVQNQRKKIGFGLERAGCELANFERNTVISNDEEVFQVSLEEEEGNMDIWYQR